jgi:hypothetical protein
MGEDIRLYWLLLGKTDKRLTTEIFMADTPEQIADRIVNRENTAMVERNREFWTQRIAQSITVAVGNERQRCVEIARSLGDDHIADAIEMGAEMTPTSGQKV